MIFELNEKTRETYCPGPIMRIWRVLEAAGFKVERYGRPVTMYDLEKRGIMWNDPHTHLYEVWLQVSTQNGDEIEIR
jgi:hypothetical protein